MIYGIGVREHGHIKIGYTKSNPILRLKDLQVGNPHKLDIFFKIDGDTKYEKKIHESLKKYRMNGEWFELNKIALKEIVKNGFISFPIVDKNYSYERDSNFKDVAFQYFENIILKIDVLDEDISGEYGFTKKELKKVLKNEGYPNSDNWMRDNILTPLEDLGLLTVGRAKKDTRVVIYIPNHSFVNT